MSEQVTTETSLPFIGEALEQQLALQWQGLEIQLLERMSPLLESLRPVWSDPLWQFIAVIALLGLGLALAMWLLRASTGALATFVEGLGAIFFGPLVGLKNLLSDGSEKLRDRRQQADQQDRSSGRWFNRASIRQGMDVVRYLTTRRDWRYQSPWYLLTGADNSGRSEWVTSIKSGVRSQLMVREKQLLAKGSGWHFFDQGLIVDVDSEQSFTQTVELLNCYRPERPLDGVIVTVSAEALLQAETATQRRELGESLYRQLWAVQKETGFVVPVYVLVTRCEAVTGFEAFWGAGSEERLKEMFGWSNPTRLDTAYSSRWVAEAFDSAVEGVRAAQLQVAASGQDICDIDGFMLFDREFQQLQQPLQEVMEFAFSRSSFQDAMPLRGIWFNGRVEGEIVLSEDFLARKLWPETHLANPVEQRRFSANRTLRRFQYASLAAAVLLVMALVIDSTRLYRYSKVSEQTWEHILLAEPDCSDTGTQTWRLLSGLSKIADQPFTLSLPGSWGGGQLPELEEAAARRIYPNSVFPALECRLKLKAEALHLQPDHELDNSADVAAQIELLREFSDKLTDYQQAQRLFIRLAGPLAKANGVAEDFRTLVDYLYDGAIPASVQFDSPLLVQSIVETAYDLEWDEEDLVDPDEQLLRLNELAIAAREKIEQQVTQPPVSDIQRAFFAAPKADAMALTQQSSGVEMAASLENFQQWLNHIQQQWLSVGPSGSPCGRMHNELSELQQTLSDAGYARAPLRRAVSYFDTENCDELVRHRMQTLNVAPLGKLFSSSAAGHLALSSQLQKWRREFEALESINLLSRNFKLSQQAVDFSAGDNSQAGGKIVDWQSAPLDQAVEVLLAFQAYRQQWWQSSAVEPFYAQALRQRLHLVVAQLISQAQVRELAQLPKPLSSPRDPEGEMSRRIGSFKRVEGLLRQLSILLQQEGESGNAVALQNSSRHFVRAQLQSLEKLVSANRLYLPRPNPAWQKDNFAFALFSYNDPVELEAYLQNQRQRVAYLAQNYARPLVSYLLDSGGIAQTDSSAKLWFDTLVDLRRYERKEPGNGIAELESFVADQLAKLQPDNCTAWLATPSFSHTSGGLFAARQYEIDSTLRHYCQTYGKTAVIRRYLALAEKFNQQLAGRFPFAGLEQANRNELSPAILRAFLADYRNNWANPEQGQTLRQGLQQLIQAQPQLGLGSWLEFVEALDQLAEFWQRAESDDGSLQVALAAEFAAMPEASLGARQIIEWQLGSGSELLTFPNGGDRLQWQPGDQLSLSLRWASGSEFMPVRHLQTPVQVDEQKRRALFSSQGRWALFEWLQRFCRREAGAINGSLLSFQVPVTPRNGLTDPAFDIEAPLQAPAYLSRVNLLLSLVISQQDGSERRVAIPALLPRSAPGLPGESTTQGGTSLASASN